MLIADSQVHIWTADTPERPWPAARNAPHRPVPFSKDDLLREMDAAGVTCAVLIPPRWAGECNDLALEAARLHPDRFGVMGRIDVGAEASRDLIATWRQAEGMLGLRLSRVDLDPAGEWLWSRAETAGVPVMLATPAARLESVAAVAQRYPRLRLTIDHLAMPNNGKKDDAAFADLNMLLTLARHPNVAVKASALPAYTTDVYPFRRIHPYIRRVYDAFGPRRMFWGTDLTKQTCTYRQLVTMFTEELPWLTVEDKEWIMGRGLCEWIGWNMTAAQQVP